MQDRFHVLIVDNISENIQVAMSILKERNYPFSFALNGEKALELVEENDYDLILLDIMMLGLNGFEVCTRLKRHSLSADIPVIFLTAKIFSNNTISLCRTA